MNFENFLLEVREGGVAIFTINRPEVRNALNTECWEEIKKLADWVNGEDSIKLLVLTGEGDKAFAAGADIRSLETRNMVDALGSVAQNALKALADCEKPTIAAVNGVAFGGGCELTLACDIRIASTRARFGLPELGLGILPGAGGTQRLSRLIGLGRAKEMILTGRTIAAEEAEKIGLVTQIVEPENLMGAVLETAERILSKGPLAVRLAKKAVNMSLSTPEECGMMLERLSYSILIGSEDKQEGVKAFLEKRDPSFQGR